ncbi:MAG: tetratricopeptide repeat protein [Acidobacteriota bacterium]
MDVKQLEQKLATLQKAQDKLEVLDDIAAHYYDEEDYSQAVTYYQQAVKLTSTGNSRAYFQGMEGICCFLMNQDEAAYRALTDARETLHPDEEDFDSEIYGLVHYFLGSLYEYGEKNEASLESRLKAQEYLTELDPEVQWMLLVGISRNYELQGDFQKAVKYNIEAISLISGDDPEIVYIFESLGYSYHELGEYDKALEYFSRILEVDQGFERQEEIYFNIGLCNRRLLNFRMALDSYLKLLELKELQATSETLTWLHIEIAHCYYSLKNYDKSVEMVTEGLKGSIEDKTEKAELHSYLANNYHGMGHFEEAVEAGEQTIKISDEFHNVEIMLPNLALSYHQLGNSAKFEHYRDWCNRDFPDLSWTKQLNKLQP